MLSRRLYYLVKPYVPWHLRMAMRRIVARKKRSASIGTWPINESAGRPPADWPGWPEGKKFAVVLTHDVEGPEGVAKCRQLAELEMAAGFRSSFNFIPEGTYQVPAALRNWLTENGFEVGVHDLNHDGKLFDSPEGFRRKGERINHYLKEWGATGFRAGFMLRNLEWYHQLDIAYDASTFDTDPFEPQSDGAGTIFPFWIAAPTHSGRPRNGYVELPYSLPQDSTLFLVFREPSPEIWLRKADWVAGRGGMVLVNVHPDYLRFDGESPSARTFSAAHYRQLLLHLRERFQTEYWQPLPKTLADWYVKSCIPAMTRSNPHVPAKN